jgi:hypothetical protein
MNEQLLYKFVEDRRRQGFAWGQNDCNTLCLAWLDELAGSATLKIAKGKYKNALGAAKYQKKIGHRLSDVLKQNGAVEIAPALQQEGDFIIANDDKWDCGHVCLGRYVLSAGPDSGCTVYKLKKFTGYTVWRVECRN